MKAGNATLPAVLCTESKTFSMKVIESSNTTLVVRSGSDSASGAFGDLRAGTAAAASIYHSVEAMPTSYISLIECTPPFHDIQRILLSESYPFSGEEHESKYLARGRQLFTFDSLLTRAQCSKTELKAALKHLNAIEINGKY